MSWRQISTNTREDLAEHISDLFSEAGALSISMQAADEEEIFEPPIGETRVWKKTRVIALFEQATTLAEVQQQLSQALGSQNRLLTEWQEEIILDQAWERAWLEHFKPMQFGAGLWVVPTSYEPPDPDATNISLDPGLAFGTGTHATTALCLKWLAGQSLTQQQVLDFGCGSGILAVAAAKLGAAAVSAVDIDPQAITATRNNAANNQVAALITCYLPEQLPSHRFDIVIANILAGPLVELAETICSHLRPGGRLVLSGILPDQADSVIEAYQKQIRFEPVEIFEGWVRLAGIQYQ